MLQIEDYDLTALWKEKRTESFSLGGPHLTKKKKKERKMVFSFLEELFELISIRGGPVSILGIVCLYMFGVQVCV